jgi:hypothetical protein
VLEITPPTEPDQPLALRAEAGREAARIDEPPQPEVVPPQPEIEPVRAQPVPPLRSQTQEPVPSVPDALDPEVEVEPAVTPVGDEEGKSMPASPSAASTRPAKPRPQGLDEGLGSGGTGGGRGLGIYGTPDHAAYGAEIVRLVKAEIDHDPVPGLGARDSVELVLEVLPSGRLARRGLGKYDYAQVVRSTLGPLRMRAVLRRVLRASEDFPPHPSTFPRQRFVVGITVNFRALRG